MAISGEFRIITNDFQLEQAIEELKATYSSKKYVQVQYTTIKRRSSRQNNAIHLYCKLADNNVMIYPAPRWLGFYYRWHPQQATWKVQHEGKGYDQMIQTFWKEKWNL